MDSQNALEFLESEIQKRIRSFDEKRIFYRKKATQLTIGTAFLSSLTTFLIGVSQAYDFKPISIAALAASAGITLLTALDSLYSYRRRWVQNNDIVMNFYELSSDITYSQKTSPDNRLSLDKVNIFYERYKDILRSANEGWKADRLTEPKKVD